MSNNLTLKQLMQKWPEHNKYKNSRGEWKFDTLVSFEPGDFQHQLTPPAKETLACMFWAGGSISANAEGVTGVYKLRKLKLAIANNNQCFFSRTFSLTAAGHKLAVTILQTDLLEVV
jgi:hypothetical protein